MTNFIKWLVSDHLREEILGDLHERYARRKELYGEATARRRFLLEAMAYVRPAFINRQNEEYVSTPLFNTFMISNYLKIAWRNLLKHKLFSFINILGLSLAIPSALMGLIQIVNYYEYDNFHHDEGRIVRLITDEKQKDGTITNWASSPVPLGRYIKENFPGIDHSTTIVRDRRWALSDGIKTKDVNPIYTEESFFRMFSFPLEKGAYPVDPNTIAVTHETAQWFFRDSNPIGKILQHPKYGSFKVVGVLRPFDPLKTQFRTDLMVSFASFPKSDNKADDWSALKAHTFLKISKGVTSADLGKQLSMASTHVNKLIKTAENKKLNFKAQYLSEISPSKDVLENDPFVQDIRSMYINLGFQLIMILLASLNYINLTLARSVSRGREVGVRKVNGATKLQLVFQFLVESVLVSYISLTVGLLLLWFIKTQMHLSWLTWNVDHIGYLILACFVFNLVLGLVAGMFPSLILSAYQPLEVLKGIISPASFGKIGFRKSLIVAQFAIALIYIFFIGHMLHQIKYMATENQNYQRNDILNLNLVKHKHDALATDLTTLKEVERIGYTSLTFGNLPTHSSIKNAKNDAAQLAYYYAADHNFIENMGLRIVAGKNLVVNKSDSSSSMIVVNQKAVEKLGLGSEQDAIGKLIILNDTVSATIVGIVADFCHYDYEAKIEPVVFQYQPSLFKVMCLKTNAVEDRKLLEGKVKSLFEKYNPYQELDAEWLDTRMYERYFPDGDMQFFVMEGLVILVIAILGLIGILVYSLEKRTKEIGIRKVIGATMFDVIKLMSDDFIRLLVIATVIAIPLGIAVGFKMNSYFVFNNGIGYWMMSLLLSTVIGIAMAAVAYFSWEAAKTNPATTLKAE